jgi:hypothetical protein
LLGGYPEDREDPAAHHPADPDRYGADERHLRRAGSGTALGGFATLLGGFATVLAAGGIGADGFVHDGRPYVSARVWRAGRGPSTRYVKVPLRAMSSRVRGTAA